MDFLPKLQEKVCRAFLFLSRLYIFNKPSVPQSSSSFPRCASWCPAASQGSCARAFAPSPENKDFSGGFSRNCLPFNNLFLMQNLQTYKAKNMKLIGLKTLRLDERIKTGPVRITELCQNTKKPSLLSSPISSYVGYYPHRTETTYICSSQRSSMTFDKNW